MIHYLTIAAGAFAGAFIGSFIVVWLVTRFSK